MWDPTAIPPASDEEIRLMETEANFTVQKVIATAVTLYLSPFVVDAVKKIF